jgi:hypothetical protein
VEKLLPTAGDAKGRGGDSASAARDSGGGGGGRSSSDMRYYAHVVAVVNLLRYQQILVLLQLYFQLSLNHFPKLQPDQFLGNATPFDDLSVQTNQL